MNSNIFGNKTSHFRQAFRVHIRPFPFSTGQPQSPFSTWRSSWREQAKSECDWVVMSSVFVASQSSCFFLCSSERIGLVENKLN